MAFELLWRMGLSSLVAQGFKSQLFKAAGRCQTLGSVFTQNHKVK